MLVCDYKYGKKTLPTQENKSYFFGILKGKMYIYYHTNTFMKITKYCSKCDTTQPIEQFCKTKRSIDGHSWTCKTCVKAYQVANKEKLKEYQRNYQPQYKAEHKKELLAYLKNYQKTVGKAKHLEYIKTWKAANPEKVAQYKKVMAERKQQAND
jgi:hypothetical protein